MSLYDRVVERMARTKVGAWVFVRIATPLDKRIMKWSKGRLSSGMGSRFHEHSVLLTTLGAKSGLERSTPLLGTPDGDRLVLIASFGGAPQHPAWYGNLKKNPRCRALFRGASREYVAREAEGEERERLWTLAVAGYSGYAKYQERVERRIPVMVLEPV